MILTKETLSAGPNIGTGEGVALKVSFVRIILFYPLFFRYFLGNG